MHFAGKIIRALGAAAGILTVAAVAAKPGSVYRDEPEEQNPMEGKMVRFVENEAEPENADGARGHLEEAGTAVHHDGFYEKIVKRGADVILSFFALILLSPLFIIISIAICIDDPGPVIFTQKRVGRNKRFFRFHKFRSMSQKAPANTPTHMLENPEKHITRVGRILRKTSLDELPQIWDIFIGNMSVIGPRPALWNQDLLTAERDKWGANDVTPGLTGWAQTHGRDEIEIPEKARLDGEYCRNLTFRMDATCFLITIANVARSAGVIEGGTGALSRQIGKRNREIDETSTRR